MNHGERFNGYTHFVGAILALAGAGLLIGLATLRADPVRIASFSIYGATLCLLYLASTLYHSTRTFRGLYDFHRRLVNKAIVKRLEADADFLILHVRP